MKRIDPRKRILSGNDAIAAENREYFRKNSIRCVNIMGSPGAGKTSLLEVLIPRIRKKRGVFVIEGDLATSNDAERIEKTGVKVFQVETGGACHLDAGMVARALEVLGPTKGSIVFIENVGNLVCPASFDLGEDSRLVLLSVTEGDDKILKYPPMFRKADSLAITKTDLLSCLKFDSERIKQSLAMLGHSIPVFNTSAHTGEGLEDLEAWILGGL